MASELPAPTQEQIEDALKKTLYGWADELDTGRKFWWADWAKLIGDAITAVRTGEAVLYPEDYVLHLRAVRDAASDLPRFQDVVDAWELRPDGQPRPDWTRWRAWLDALDRRPEWIPEAIYLPPSSSGHVVIDALMAAIAEKLADDSGLPRPSWTGAIPPLDEPYESAARRRGAVPEHFERRGLLIDADSLFRPNEVLDR